MMRGVARSSGRPWPLTDRVPMWLILLATPTTRRMQLAAWRYPPVATIVRAIFGK
ncbi:hypothetical protein [Lysobacter gummosus]|uniref:hypothetical protein n=1 Tax=Lysobacter gummosus TaxID=262324 RepID=UPI00362597DF